MKRYLSFVLIGIMTITLFNCFLDSTKSNVDQTEPPIPGTTGSITGMVSNELGSALRGVSISAQGPNARYSAFSDQMGSYSFLDIPGGIYTITFKKYGFSDGASQSITIITGDTVIAQGSVLQSNLITIRGRVIIPGLAKQGARSAQKGIGIALPKQSISTQTDSTGTFILENVDPTTTENIVAAKSGSGWGDKTVTLLPGKDTVEVEITLNKEGGSIQGTVVGIADKPLPNVLVEAIGGGVSAITDSGGNYHLANVPSGVPIEVVSVENTSISGLMVDEGSQLDGVELTPQDTIEQNGISVSSSEYVVPDTGTVTLRADVNLMNRSGSEKVSMFIWDMDGDGIYETDASVPTVSLNEAGNKSVSYGVVTESGDSIKGAQIEVKREPSIPVIKLGQEVIVDIIPQELTNLPGNATCLSGGIVSYQWDFNGDGILDWKRRDGGKVKYRYYRAGTYKAMFLVISSSGQRDSAYIVITVKDVPPASLLSDEVAQPELISPLSGDFVGTDVLLRWTNVGAESYSVIMDESTPPSTILSNGITADYLYVTGLTPGMTYYLKIIAHKGLNSAESFCTKIIASISSNTAPHFLTLPEAMLSTVVSGNEYRDTVQATDAENDILQISFLDSVAGMTINNGILSWTPGSADTGVHSVSLVADDAKGGRDTLTWSVRVINSSDASLLSLGVSAGTLSPEFSSATATYSVYVGNEQGSLFISPVVSHPEAKVFVNSITVPYGDSTEISLSIGSNLVTIDVTAADGVSTKRYTVTITRLGADNAVLAGLSLSAGMLTPRFQPDSIYYSAVVVNEIDSIAILPTAGDINASITVNGVEVQSGTLSALLPLNVGSNRISVKVTAQNQTSSNTYSISITRQGNSNAYLSGIAIAPESLTPQFNPTVLSYSAALKYTDSLLRVVPTAVSPKTTISVNNDTVISGTSSLHIPLAVGDNLINVITTAEDGMTRLTYYLVITREAEPNINLSALVSSTGNWTPDFNGSSELYTVTVSSSISRITFTPTALDSTATITVGSQTVSSGTSSDSINLITGNNTVNIVVTAENGVTKKTYTITVRRLSNSATLNALTSSGGTLSPNFNSINTSYVFAVSNSTSNVTFTPTATDSNATITVNGDTVISGNESNPVNLIVGNNPIPVVVTAEDGITIRTYTVTIDRAPSTDATLSNLIVSKGSLSPVFSSDEPKYIDSIPWYESYIAFTPTASHAQAKIKIENQDVVSGEMSDSININKGGPVPITIIVTAEDGVTLKEYVVMVTPFNLPPEITGMQNVSIDFREPFENINLDDYVADPDHHDSTLIWEVDTIITDNNGFTPLEVTIGSPLHNTSFSIPTGADWYGSNTIRFSARDPRGGRDTASVIYSMSGWKSYSQHISSNIQTIAFPSPDTGFFIALDEEIIFRTIDQGKNWSPIHFKDAGASLYDMYFLNKSIGWASGSNGQVLRTSDAGETWNSPTTTNNLATYYGVHFSDATNGWVAGIKGGITVLPCVAKTTNAGLTWTETTTPGTPLNTVHSFSTDEALVAGNDGNIYRTVNGGASWTTVHTGTESIYSMFFIDSKNGWAGAAHSVYRTTDGGLNWTASTLAPVQYIYQVKSVHFVNNQLGWAIGHGQVPGVYKTIDGGVTWTEIPSNYSINYAFSIVGFGTHEAIIANGTDVNRYGPNP
ncbi:MAG: cadherin-like beta sandwich domain-containing protein [Fibrobacteria bacterium]|nr:cadherin-like beta sandwich domain-containing protein [Fibrobacteria bacterium]